MSSKFGLPLEENTPKPDTLAASLRTFPTSSPRPVPAALRELDTAAAQHGFVSREGPAPARRRRRVATEITRHLAMRVPESTYNRFLQYADKLQMTYHDALKKLLEESGY